MMADDEGPEGEESDGEPDQLPWESEPRTARQRKMLAKFKQAVRMIILGLKVSSNMRATEVQYYNSAFEIFDLDFSKDHEQPEKSQPDWMKSKFTKFDAGSGMIGATNVHVRAQSSDEESDSDEDVSFGGFKFGSNAPARNKDISVAKDPVASVPPSAMQPGPTTGGGTDGAGVAGKKASGKEDKQGTRGANSDVATPLDDKIDCDEAFDEKSDEGAWGNGEDVVFPPGGESDANAAASAAAAAAAGNILQIFFCTHSTCTMSHSNRHYWPLTDTNRLFYFLFLTAVSLCIFLFIFPPPPIAFSNSRRRSSSCHNSSSNINSGSGERERQPGR